MTHSSRPASPNRAEQLASEPLRAGLAVTHHAPAGAQNSNPKAIKHRPQLTVPPIQSPARPAAAFVVADDLLPFRAIFQVNPQYCLATLGFRAGLKIRVALRAFH